MSHWNTYQSSVDNKSDADDVGFIDAVLDVMEADYYVDTSRVYATGYSNGGDFTYTLACLLSDRVTGIAPVSGLMWEQTRDECSPSHPTAVVHLHGTADWVRPYDGYPGYLMSVAAAMDYWATHNGIAGAPTMTSLADGGQAIERYRYEGGEGGVTMTHYKVVGGDHIWFDIEDDGAATDQLIWSLLSGFDQAGAI